MLGIFADSFLKATHQDDRNLPRWNAPRHWITPETFKTFPAKKGARHD